MAQGKINRKDLNAYLKSTSDPTTDTNTPTISRSDLNAYMNQAPAPTAFLTGGQEGVLEFGEDVHNRDYLDDSYSFLSGYDTAELRANRQPWLAKTGSGLGRFGTKVIAEISKMPGVLGGILAGTGGQVADLITGEDNTDFIQVAFNNPWIQAVTDMEDKVKEDILPVYVRKAVSEGNLWDNITSMDFWATEGADGLGYIVSMLAPGALINRANLGAKLLKGATKYQRMLGKTEEAAQALKKIGATPQNINLHSATVANTLFEAGAEAKGAMDSYVDNLNRRRLLHPSNSEYIDEEQYNSLLAKQSEVGRNVFLSNVGILIGPNAIMSKILWGNKVNATSVKKVNGSFEQLKKLTTKDKILTGAKAFGQGAMREGFFEEGLQSVAETYFTEHPERGIGDLIGDLPRAYGDMVSSVDGQKAIFLGAVFGGGMSAYQEVQNEKAKIASANMLINGANSILKDFDSFFDTDARINDNEEREFEGTEQKPDPKKVVDKMRGLSALEELGEKYDKAIEEGDMETVNNIRELMTTQLIKPFIVNEHLGLDALRQHLQDSQALLKQANKEGFNINTYVKDIMDKAEYLKNQYEVFKAFGESFLTVDNAAATKTDKVDFYNKMAMEYVGNKSLQRYFGNKLKNVDTKLADVYKEYEEELVKKSFNQEAHQKLIDSDSRLPALLKEQKALGELVKETIKNDKEFWNTEKVNKKFNERVKEAAKIRKVAEEKQQIQDVFDSIKAAKTTEELNKIEIPDTEAGKLAKDELDKAIEERRVELMSEKERKELEKKQKAQQEKEAKEQEIADKEEAIKFMKENFDEGDTITIPSQLIPENKRNTKVDQGYEIVKYHERSLTLKNAEGKTFAISALGIADKATFLEATDSTEGGETELKEFYSKNQTSGRVVQDMDARLLTQNDLKGEENKPLGFTNEALMAFERNAKDKTGTYQIKINDFRKDGTTGNPDSDLALEMVANKDFSDVEHLVNYLPISVVFAEGIEAPLDTRREGNAALFDASTKRLKMAIVQELKAGTKIENISVDMVGQFNGELQLDGENNNIVSDLFEFQGDLKNITTEHIFVVDDNGVLKNVSGEVMSSNRPLAKGEVYIKIHTASGNEFPLKLNVAKIGDIEADIIYELVKYRFDNRFDSKGAVREDDHSETTPMSELPEVLEMIRSTMPEVVKLFKADKRNIEDVTVKELMNFFAYGSANPKSRLRFASNKPHFLAGSKVFNKADIDNNPQAFKDHLKSFKRRHIKIRRSRFDANNLNLTNKKYLDYLISQSILSTNAVVGKNNHTFAGRTTMYVDPSSVKVKGKESQFNQRAVYRDNDNFIGTQEELEAKLPGLFEDNVVQTTNETGYVNEDTGEKFDRVTSLKPGKISEEDKMYNAAKRGTFIDDVLREFFSTPNMTRDDFLLFAEGALIRVNDAKPDTELDFSDDVLDELYNIFTQYRRLFNELNYTVYARETVVYGQLGAKGNIAGTMDLLAYDNVNKKWRIIDLKTSSVDRREIYEQPGKGAYPYKNNDSIQQNAYRELFEQRTGEKADIHILPITLKPDDPETGDTYSFLPQTVSKDATKKDTLSEEEAKRKDMILDVEQRPIYSILKINRKVSTPTKTKKDTPKQKVVTNKKQDSGRVQTNPNFDLREAVFEIINDENPYNITVDGEGFTVTNPIVSDGKVTGGFYILSQEDNRYVDSEEEAMKIIKAVIAKFGENGNFTKNNAQKIWNSRKNSVPLQQKKVTKKRENTNVSTKKTTKVDSAFRQELEQMTNEDDIILYKNTMFNMLEIDDMGIFPDRLDAQTEELDREPTEKEQMLLIYDFLVERGKSEQEIENECT